MMSLPTAKNKPIKYLLLVPIVEIRGELDHSHPEMVTSFLCKPHPFGSDMVKLLHFIFK